jgi:hypothetical protein
MLWTSPADIKLQVQRYWDEGRILRAELEGEALFPLAMRFRKPTGNELSERFDDVRKWIRDLEEGSSGGQGFGYEIGWTAVDNRRLGRNRVPNGIRVPTSDDALQLIEKTSDAERFRLLCRNSRESFPALAEWLARHPMTVLQYAEDWTRLLVILKWFQDHPRAGLYLRQLDIDGIDTKFIEGRKGVLSELLDIVLPSEAVDTRFVGGRLFESRYGLRSKPPLVRFRLLDPSLSLNGFSDISVPQDDFVCSRIAVERVFVMENDVNGLAFPDCRKSLVIFGLGYSLNLISEAEWLHNTRMYYWGDIDTHGFAILDRLRAAFPHAESFLMDRETLDAHRQLCVTEDKPCQNTLTRLTPPEMAVFEDLKYDRLGKQLRLEQERISFGWITQALALISN